MHRYRGKATFFLELVHQSIYHMKVNIKFLIESARLRRRNFSFHTVHLKPFLKLEVKKRQSDYMCVCGVCVPSLGLGLETVFSHRLS